MPTDLSLSSAAQVIALLQQTNNIATTEFNIDDVDLINPTALVDHPTGKNTELTIQSKPNSRYVGTVMATYNRLLIGDLTQYGSLTINIQEGDGEAELLSALNSAYGCNLSADDVTVSNFELVDYDGEIVTFTAKATSLAWLGELDLIVKWNQTALSSILVTTNLTGLTWPGISLPKLLGVVTAQTSAPVSHSYVHVVYAESKIYVASALIVNTGSNRLYSINVDTGAWTRLADSPGLSSGNRTGLMSYHNGKLYKLNRNFCDIYTIANNSWLQVVFTDKPEFANHGVTWKDNLAYLVAATGIQVYNALTNSWSNLTTYPVGKEVLGNNFSSCVVHNNHLHLLSRDSVPTQEHWKLNLSTLQWTQLSDSPRKWIYNNPVVLNDYFYHFGDSGFNGADPTNTLWCYDTVLDEWTLIETTPAAYASYANGVVAVNEEIRSIGGRGDSSSLNTVIKIT